jgi:hypothetical protein
LRCTTIYSFSPDQILAGTEADTFARLLRVGLVTGAATLLLAGGDFYEVVSGPVTVRGLIVLGVLFEGSE